MTPQWLRNGCPKKFQTLNSQLFRTAILEPLRIHFAKIAHKVRKSKYFSKFKLDRNLQKIPFNMMYNMSMLRHRFSNERWGAALNHLPLLFCKSVFRVELRQSERRFYMNVIRNRNIPNTERTFNIKWKNGMEK